MTGQGPRSRLVDTAARLFYEKGIPNVGINEVIAAADVARRTLYHHFASKEELVLAVMQTRSEILERTLRDRIETAATAEERLLALFEVAKALLGGEPFRGCATLNAALETARPDSAVHALARTQKTRLRNLLARLAQEAGAADPRTLSWQLLMLWDGALAECYVHHSRRPLDAAIEAARDLVRLALSGTGPASRR